MAIGRNTLDILIWHFLAFKAVSYLIIHVHDLPIERLQDFPVMTETGTDGSYWVLYALVGVGASLAFGELIRLVTGKITPRIKAAVTAWSNGSTN